MISYEGGKSSQADASREQEAQETPLEEHMCQPLDDKGIISEWNRLAACGKTNWKMANIIAKEHGGCKKNPN